MQLPHHNSYRNTLTTMEIFSDVDMNYYAFLLLLLILESYTVLNNLLFRTLDCFIGTKQAWYIHIMLNYLDSPYHS